MAQPQSSFTLIVVTSRDGYIAGPDAAPPRDWASPEEQLRFFEAVAALDWSFVGRITHQLAWRPNRRRVVFSRSFGAPEWRHPHRLWVDPERVPLRRILETLAAAHPVGHCGILGGVAVHDWFARHGLIDAADISIEPVDFAGGLPLFTGSGGRDPRQVLPAMGLRQTEELRLNDRGTLFCRFVRDNA